MVSFFPKTIKIFFTKNQGFSLVEVLISVAIFSFILLAIASFIFWMSRSNLKSKADTDSLENARRILDVIGYEIKGAKSLYSATTSSSQLSLETLRYLPSGEVVTYIDFFLCGTDICFKKEGQNPVSLNSDSVQISNLQFAKVVNGETSSIKISLTVDYKNTTGDSSSNASTVLQSTVALRSY